MSSPLNPLRRLRLYAVLLLAMTTGFAGAVSTASFPATASAIDEATEVPLPVANGSFYRGTDSWTRQGRRDRVSLSPSSTGVSGRAARLEARRWAWNMGINHGIRTVPRTAADSVYTFAGKVRTNRRLTVELQVRETTSSAQRVARKRVQVEPDGWRGISLPVTPRWTGSSLRVSVVAVNAPRRSVMRVDNVTLRRSEPLSTPVAPESPVAPTQWRTVFRDDFNGTSLDTSKWGMYVRTFRRAENVIVRDGVLTLRTKRMADGSFTGAGVSNAKAFKSTYGRYTVRARLDKGRGTRAVALLWPADEVWPPELDFFEVGGNDPQRTTNEMSLHYQDPLARSGRGKHWRKWNGDLTQWRTYQAEWEPGKITIRIDGHVVATYHRNVPNKAMWLGLQTGLETNEYRPDERTPDIVDFQIDYAQVEQSIS